MSKQKKIYAIIAVCLVVLIIIIAGIYIYFNPPNTNNNKNTNEQINSKQNQSTELEDASGVNSSPKLKETKEWNGFKIANAELVTNGKITTLIADVTNITDKVKEETTGYIILVDNEGNELATMGLYVRELNPNETTKLNSSVTFDYSDAYDFIIKNEK